MKVLVTGAGGQLGLDLLDAFADHDVVGTTHGDFDVTDEAAVVARLVDERPDLVVNAAAWTDVDGCEHDPDRAHGVNALGPWWLARACGLVGAALVHVSTDYVFGGAAGDGRPARPYTEFDPVAPINAYGRSKAAGESLVRETLREHYIVRSSWLFGARGSNFVTTMLRLGEERGRVEVVDDQVGCPTFTRDLAAAILDVAVGGRFGTYHRTSAGSCSWFELAVAIFELADLTVDVEPISSADLRRAAPRPSYSVLSNQHAIAAGGAPLPDWRDGLGRMLAELMA